jgi:uncharacterized membrane protein YjjP (DUF1212 family)
MNEEENLNVSNESSVLGTLLLDIGISLLQAGANTGRTRATISDLAALYKYVPSISMGPRSISLALSDRNGNTLFHGIRSASLSATDFSVISEMIGLSFKASENGWSPQELKREFTKCRVSRQYPRLVILCFVGLAGAAFCYTFGGSLVETAITFGATFTGLLVKQQLTKLSFNPYICTYIAAMSASLFTGLFHITGLINSPANAFSTCVLFLIPGVPLINSFTDLMEGSTLNGIVKGVTASIHIFAIALALLTTIVILNLKG